MASAPTTTRCVLDLKPLVGYLAFAYCKKYPDYDYNTNFNNIVVLQYFNNITICLAPKFGPCYSLLPFVFISTCCEITMEYILQNIILQCIGYLLPQSTFICVWKACICDNPHTRSNVYGAKIQSVMDTFANPFVLPNPKLVSLVI